MPTSWSLTFKSVTPNSIVVWSDDSSIFSLSSYSSPSFLVTGNITWVIMILVFLHVSPCFHEWHKCIFKHSATWLWAKEALRQKIPKKNLQGKTCCLGCNSVRVTRSKLMETPKIKQKRGFSIPASAASNACKLIMFHGWRRTKLIGVFYFKTFSTKFVRGLLQFEE